VVQHHWLTSGQFIDAVAMGLITPGPVVITATFIGYLVAGLPGAIVATIAIFTPIYLGVAIPGRWFVRHRDHPPIKASSGSTAAAAGAIAGAVVVLTRQTVTDLPTAAIAVVSFGLLWKKIPNQSSSPSAASPESCSATCAQGSWRPNMRAFAPPTSASAAAGAGWPSGSPSASPPDVRRAPPRTGR
jgi:hypothetical protein